MSEAALNGRPVERRVTRAVVVGLVVFIAGVARDLQWHATHDTQREFETASKQVEIHWLLWLGMAVLVVAGWLAVRRARESQAVRGYQLLVTSGIVYGVVSVWHFIEHANGSDPQVAHAFLYGASVGAVAGAIVALVAERRARAYPPAAGESAVK